jgi:hypothetical protein
MSGNSNKISYNTLKGKTEIVVSDPIHNMKGIEDPLTHLTVGSGLACYGRTYTQINGRVIEKYYHFTFGDYILDPPLLFKTFHAEIK